MWEAADSTIAPTPIGAGPTAIPVSSAASANASPPPIHSNELPCTRNRRTSARAASVNGSFAACAKALLRRRPERAGDGVDEVHEPRSPARRDRIVDHGDRPPLDRGDRPPARA